MVKAMSAEEQKIIDRASPEEQARRIKFLQLFKSCPIPERELLSQLGLFTRRQDLSRQLFMHEMYQRIIGVPGIVIEFGVRWGQNLALFSSFRGIHEPYNHTRKIVGFDTFAGFPTVHAKDGTAEIATTGAYGVTDNYDEYLEQVLNYHESESPVSHMKKFELVKGDAGEQTEKYLIAHPETIIALAYFDLDLYEPTKRCLQAIRSHLTKGSVIGFDELNISFFPGETQALKEVLGLDRYRIYRSPYGSSPSYLIVE